MPRKRVRRQKRIEPIINPHPISDKDKCYIFVVKNKTENYDIKNPRKTIIFELSGKYYYDMETNIRIIDNPTRLYLYNKESKIITGPFIGLSPVYRDNRKGIKFPSKINVEPMTNYLRVFINDNKIREGVCSERYITDIIYQSLPKLPTLDVGIQVNEKSIDKKSQKDNHISEEVFASLKI